MRKKLSKLNKDNENQNSVVNNQGPDNIAFEKGNLKRIIVNDHFCEDDDTHTNISSSQLNKDIDKPIKIPDKQPEVGWNRFCGT